MYQPEFEIGDVIPNWTLTDEEQNSITINEAMGENGLLLYTLRGTWCPFCVHQIVATRSRYDEFLKLGIKMNFIIPEAQHTVDSFAMTVSRPLPFGLHSDPNAELANLFTGKPAPSHVRNIGIYLINTDREIVWKFVGSENEYPTSTIIMRAIENHAMNAEKDAAKR